MDGLIALDPTFKSLFGLRCLESRICQNCEYQVISSRHWLVVDVNSWFDIFDDALGSISLQMMIETIVQRMGEGMCNLCGVRKCIMEDYQYPQKYLIFNAEKVCDRVYWNSEITIGAHLYTMVGVVKHSPGQFYCDV